MGKIICIFNIHRKTEGGYSMRIYRLCNIIISYSSVNCTSNYSQQVKLIIIRKQQHKKKEEMSCRVL